MMSPPVFPSEAALLNPREAAARLSVSERTLWAITAPRGPVPCARIGRSVRYRPADLDGYARRLAEASLAESATSRR